MTPHPSTLFGGSRSLAPTHRSRAACALVLPAFLAATCVWGAWQPAGAAVIAAPAVASRYPTTNVAVELNGKYVGFVRSASGGDGVRDVIVTQSQPGLTDKHLGDLRYEPIVIEVGPEMKKEWWDWITAALDGRASETNGALVTLNANKTAVRRLSFFRASISEVMFPTMVQNAKEPGSMRVTLQPGETRLERAAGAYSAATSDTLKAAARLWSRFSLELAPIGEASQRIARIESLTVKLPGKPAVGEHRMASETPSGTNDISPLVFTVPATYSNGLVQWHKSFVLDNQNGPDREVEGSLRFLDPRGAPLVTLELKGVGIYRLAAEEAQEGAAVSRLEARLYCERIRLRKEGQ